MLSYAYQSLNESGYKDIELEAFKNVHDLFAAILIKGISSQIKRGLHRDYIQQTEAIGNLRGKIDITKSVKQQTMITRQMVCHYDLFLEDSPLNQILKSAMTLLIRHGDVKQNNKKILRKLLLYFSNVKNIDPYLFNWNAVSYHRNNATYKMLINICWLVIKGLLLSMEDGKYKMAQFLDDQQMHRLYEKFVLGYYRKEYPQLTANASYIDWDIGVACDRKFLPVMKSDITLTDGLKTLIIDTKYYGHTMQTNSQYNSQTLHSNNLYQIFTYVKNRDTSNSGNVSGVLLYAKTDEEITPDNDYIMSGNQISVKTLDLNTDFSNIEFQLRSLINKFFIGSDLSDENYVNPMKRYLHIFESPTYSEREYVEIEVEMQDTMRDLGFVELWHNNLEKYNVQDIRFNNPRSYKPVINDADIIILKVLISYAHRQITHWYETSLYNYKDFFIYALRRLIKLAE